MTNTRRPRVYLHIGAAKTGTSYLQAVLWANRERLRAGGTLYPGLSSDAHFRAATDLLGQHYQEHVDPLAVGAWERLVGQARVWSGTGSGAVVMSHELFGLAEEAAVRRAAADLNWAEIHLVYTARDLARQIPAAWQEDVKNRQVLSFAEFVADLRAAEPEHFLAKLFWRLQDAPGVLGGWVAAAGVPPERVHLITLPPRGAPPDELWRRFSRVIGIAPDGCDTEVGVEANRSMGVAETNLVRRLNLEVADRLDWPSYDVLVKDYLAVQVLGGRDAAGPLRLPSGEYDWVRARAARLVEALGGTGYRVVGDLAELLPAAPSGPSTHPDQVAEAQVLDAAVGALAGLLDRVRASAQPARPGWRRTALALSERNPGIRRLHHHYLSAKARLADQRRHFR
ncbi:MAG TPA: hypothetical protein VGH89_32360 [Pseudonocardia sp.]|jgi:hypothetical protein